MRMVTIGFSKPTTKFPIYSWLIRMFERTSYSHVYLQWNTDQDVEIVYEASGRSVKFVNNEIFLDRAESVHEFRVYVNEAQYDKLLEFSYRNSGIDYGLRQAVGIALAKIFNLKRNPLSRGRDSQVCSETVLYFLREVLGIDCDLLPDMAGPRDIYNLLWKIHKEDGRVEPWKIN